MLISNNYLEVHVLMMNVIETILATKFNNQDKIFKITNKPHFSKKRFTEF